MERSKKMLLNDKIKIAEVAEKLGYSHATHFTSAFKKYFGYLPNKLRLLVLIASGCFEEILCLLEVYGV
jgi:AraC-like DNA-binding protein